MAVTVARYMEHLKFKSPFCAIVAGPSGSGKTVLLRKILEHRHVLFNRVPQNILWCYGQMQDAYSQPIANTKVSYFEGFPSKDELKELKPHLIIIDDLMSELTGDKSMSDLFTKFSHHMNIDVVFVVQNIFHHGKEMRTISLNSHYFVILKNPRDRRQIMVLADQTFPRRREYLMESYYDATSSPFGYLLLDLKPDTPECMRVRTRIVPSETIKGHFSPVIYISEKDVRKSEELFTYIESDIGD